MNRIQTTDVYDAWIDGLRDRYAKDRIANRIRRARAGNFGDHRALGDGISEMRIDYGPGYRVYYAQKGNAVYLLLVGGDKRTQENDIQKAKELWRDLGGTHNGKTR